MGDLSEHFSTREFACHGEGVRGHRAHRVIVHPELVANLERLREIVGRPLKIVSGHRCTWWNRQQHGAPASQHMRGTAADIPEGYATEREAVAAGFRGIGLKGQSALHVDVRPRRARWRY